jgi:hypothetical protein
MREIKFRAWCGTEVSSPFMQYSEQAERLDWFFTDIGECKELMQYTGLKDKNGVEIYEFMEIDRVWEVQYSNGSYVLINISNDDIITLYKYMEQKDGQIKVTKEYTKV